MSKKAADRINRAAEAEFKKWNKQADKRLTLSFYEIQRLACGALERDGECLIVLRTSNRRDRRVPLCLEGLESDRLATPHGGNLQSQNPKRHRIR